MTLRTLNYGNYGIFLLMGHAGFCPSTVSNQQASQAFTLHLFLRRKRQGLSLSMAVELEALRTPIELPGFLVHGWDRIENLLSSYSFLGLTIEMRKLLQL